MTMDEAIAKLKIYRDYLCKMSSMFDANEVAKPFNMAIEALEHNRGTWLLDGRCSECLVAPLTSHKNYCPNCGAKMDARREDD